MEDPLEDSKILHSGEGRDVERWLEPRNKFPCVFLINILQRNMFILYMLIILHIPTLLNHNIYIHIMLDILHTPSIFTLHTPIMLL